jgi:hypothetical protein
LTDGDDECVWCGHLIDAPDLTARQPVHLGVPSSLGTIHVPLPNVLTTRFAA